MFRFCYKKCEVFIVACLIVNTMLTEDSSGLECEAVITHPTFACGYSSWTAGPWRWSHCNPSQHWEVLTQQNSNTAVRTSDLKIHTLCIAYNKGSLPGISKLSIWPVYNLSMTPQLSATLNQVTMLLKYIPPTLVLFYCNCYCYSYVLHATHKTCQKKNHHSPSYLQSL